ncbi:MAG TPA: orotidine-5'-phosphate decarboxylase [Acidimicrobiales bacterium]|nr:orotidine-5'-phosphate decarboxylase [Acidimicrobiales bacterium]
MTELQIEAPEEVRARLCLALDTDDLVEAQRRARELGPWFGTLKVGLELFASAGPQAVTTLQGLGLDVFVDLKLHDIPTTVHKAAKVLGSLGVSYVTFHAHGGVDMLRAGVEGLHLGASGAGVPTPRALAVTVLTSDDSAPPHILPKRVESAVDGGCDGLVCAVADVPEARSIVPELFVATTGIRTSGDEVHDQRRTATPGAAFAAGADLLVLGRTVTHAADPVAAAAALVDNALG